MDSSKVVIQCATIEHLPFIGEALMLSERAQLDKGVWDVILEVVPADERVQVMMEAAQHDIQSHFHISRFFIAVDTTTGKPVGAACVFPYPQYTMTRSFQGLFRILEAKYGLSSDDTQAISDKVSYYSEGFPDIDYDQSYMVESVYTLPSHRGQRLAPRLIEHIIQHYCLAEGEGALGYKKMLISCAVGNDSAQRAYERVGFTLVGSGHSERCMEALGFAGFHMLRKDL